MSGITCFLRLRDSTQKENSQRKGRHSLSTISVSTRRIDRRNNLITSTRLIRDFQSSYISLRKLQYLSVSLRTSMSDIKKRQRVSEHSYGSLKQELDRQKLYYRKEHTLVQESSVHLE
jgi:hypothetical protein